MAWFANLSAMMLVVPVILGAQDQQVPTPAPQNGLIDLKSDRYERMTVPVAVEGNGPFQFLIDTGSQKTVVSSAIATQLRLQEGPQVRILGMAGIDDVASAQVGHIAFGRQSVSNLTVPVLERTHMGADGIIGTDSLQQHRVVLDFVHDRIEIGDARHLGGNMGYEIVVQARRRLGRLILTDAFVDNTYVDVVIDTGATGTIGNPALQRALRGKPAGRGTVESVTGQQLVTDVSTAREVTIGKITVHNVAIAYADAPVFHELGLGEKPAIFLGMRELRAFRRVAIDFESGKVLFDLPR